MFEVCVKNKLVSDLISIHFVPECHHILEFSSCPGQSVLMDQLQPEQQLPVLEGIHAKCGGGSPLDPLTSTTG